MARVVTGRIHFHGAFVIAVLREGLFDPFHGGGYLSLGEGSARIQLGRELQERSQPLLGNAQDLDAADVIARRAGVHQRQASAGGFSADADVAITSAAEQSPQISPDFIGIERLTGLLRKLGGDSVLGVEGHAVEAYCIHLDPALVPDGGTERQQRIVHRRFGCHPCRSSGRVLARLWRGNGS